MGQSSSWIAVKGLPRADVLGRLELEETGREAGWGQAFLRLGDLGNGWLLLHTRTFDYPTSDVMGPLSTGAEVLSCQIEEHVMVSIAQGFRDGRKIWSATHDPDKGIYSLDIEGTPPPELAAIQARLRKEQDAEGGEEAGVDFMFDAASAVVAALSGYKDDEDQGIVFMELQRAQAPKGPGLFQRLFGRR